ncbi:MAG: signal peptidase II [Nitrospinae bacterium]|nr:signal peptidase II [Nitrospinota bacterium]
MNNSLIKKISIYFVILLVIFSLDRITKNLILNILEDKEKVDIYINSFLSFYLVWNKGIGFGLFSFEESTAYNLITFLIVIINAIIIYLVFVEKGPKVNFLIIILGGSLGNLFDRLYYSAVPDFIDLNYNGYHWFIFNVADIFITIGIICLIFAELLNYKSKDEKK